MALRPSIAFLLHVLGAAFYRDDYVKQSGEWRIRKTGYERTFEQVRKRSAEGWALLQRRFE